jgi:Hint domain
MASTFSSLFTEADLQYFHQLPEVVEAKAKLDACPVSGKIYFTITPTESICTALSRFGLNLTPSQKIPMRWIKGDTAPHVDRGMAAFERTHLVYLNSAPGQLLVDTESYPIQENTGYSFQEGIHHETIDTGIVPRLLVGPMSEQAFAVGTPPNIVYYPNQAQADGGDGGYYGFTYSSFVVGDVGYGTNGGITSWRISASSSGSSSQAVVYNNGNTLNADGYYFLYPSAPCFLEGSTILCQVDGVDTYLPVEQMKVGTLVKTLRDGYKKVEFIGKGTISNPGHAERTQNRLYCCSKDRYPELTADLYMTGCHSILVDSLTEVQRKKTIEITKLTFVTDRKYRLMACVDERTEPWSSEGMYTIWHFALEHENYYANYGVYANGLLVETCSKRFMKELSNLTLL